MYNLPFVVNKYILDNFLFQINSENSIFKPFVNVNITIGKYFYIEIYSECEN